MKRSSSNEPHSESGGPSLRRFVFLWHEVPPGYGRPSHYDLMFEQPDGLRTWAAERLPRPAEGVVRARALPLHRIAYLDYEGEVSGGRGTVKQIASGHYETIVDQPQRVVLGLRQAGNRTRFIFQLLADADWDLCSESPSSRGAGNSDAR